jgi:hypothetical protein
MPFDLDIGKLISAFALESATAVLLVGSRADGMDYSGSDVDFLAVYERQEQIPALVAWPGAACADSTLSRNWVATMDGDEVNVEVIAANTLDLLAGAVRAPLGPGRSVVLQPLEVKLLGRLATGQPVAGEMSGAELIGAEAAARFPAIVTAMNVQGAASYLATARARTDPLDVEIALQVAAVGIGFAAVALHGSAVYAPKKIAPALRKLAAEGKATAVTASELQDMLSRQVSLPARLRIGQKALDTIRAAVEARSLAEGGVWTEAAGVIAV